MILDKHTWVCSVCGQGLTRKSTANRHNNNLHFGEAMIVRPYEYIIGRLNGTFLQSDPSLFRDNKSTGQKNISGSIYHDYGNNTRTPIGAVGILGEIVHERAYGNVTPQLTKSDDVKNTFYSQSDPHLQQRSHKLVDDKAPDTVGKSLERMQKFIEFKILVEKHCPPQDAKQLIITAGMLVHQRDDDSLDRNLAFLRNIHRAKSY